MSNLIVEIDTSDTYTLETIKKELSNQVSFDVIESRRFDGDLFQVITTIVIPIMASMIPTFLQKYNSTSNIHLNEKEIKIKFKSGEIYCKNVSIDELREILKVVSKKDSSDD